MRAGRVVLWFLLICIVGCFVYVVYLLNRPDSVSGLAQEEVEVSQELGTTGLPLSSGDEEESSNLSLSDSETAIAEPSHPLAVAFGTDPSLGSREAEVFMEIFDSYRSNFGSFPTGEDNEQMMKALLGDNPRKLPVFPEDHPRINSAGALEDAWGTPFFFHVIGRDHLEIRSAGVDQEMYTEDDLVSSNRPRAAE